MIASEGPSKVGNDSGKIRQEVGNWYVSFASSKFREKNGDSQQMLNDQHCSKDSS